jgi:hypothetical protein
MLRCYHTYPQSGMLNTNKLKFSSNLTTSKSTHNVVGTIKFQLSCTKSLCYQRYVSSLICASCSALTCRCTVFTHLQQVRTNIKPEGKKQVIYSNAGGIHYRHHSTPHVLHGIKYTCIILINFSVQEKDLINMNWICLVLIGDIFKLPFSDLLALEIFYTN